MVRKPGKQHTTIQTSRLVGNCKAKRDSDKHRIQERGHLSGPPWSLTYSCVVTHYLPFCGSVSSHRQHRSPILGAFDKTAPPRTGGGWASSHPHMWFAHPLLTVHTQSLPVPLAHRAAQQAFVE